jgi:hypothetical protein
MHLCGGDDGIGRWIGGDLQRPGTRAWTMLDEDCLFEKVRLRTPTPTVDGRSR